MFSLNLYGIFVLTMFKESYLLKWGSPPQTVFTAVQLTLQHTLKKQMLLHHRLLRLQTTYRTVVHTNVKILESFLDINFLQKKYLRQPSIDADDFLSILLV